MSETRHFTGKLVYLEKNSPTETLEEQCKRISNKPLYNWADSYAEQLLDDGDYEKYIIIGDRLYETKDVDEKDADDNIFEARKINGKDFEFEVRYYDGGCSFPEAIEEALKGV